MQAIWAGEPPVDPWDPRRHGQPLPICSTPLSTMPRSTNHSTPSQNALVPHGEPFHRCDHSHPPFLYHGTPHTIVWAPLGQTLGLPRALFSLFIRFFCRQPTLSCRPFTPLNIHTSVTWRDIRALFASLSFSLQTDISLTRVL